MLLSRFIAAILTLFAAGIATAAEAGDPQQLYQAQAIVTGTGEPNRELGFKDCLGRVLVRVSGDPRVTAEPAFQTALARAGSFVADYRYHDRLEGIPIHDEQGTHDRPHDLTCLYRPDTINALLHELRRKPWLALRPKLAIFLVVRDARRNFVLTRDGGESPYMIDAFNAAATPLAMTIVVPDKAALDTAGLTATSPASAGSKRLDALAKAIGCDTALVGALRWSEKDLGWNAEWSMRQDGKAHRWHIRGVSFDDAFRNAIGGAAQLASGNGAP